MPEFPLQRLIACAFVRLLRASMAAASPAPVFRSLHQQLCMLRPEPAQACMAARGFKVLVADESHAMRANGHAPDARHTEAVAAAAGRAQRVILLSGTPSLSKPFDLFRQVGAFVEPR